MMIIDWGVCEDRGCWGVWEDRGIEGVLGKMSLRKWQDLVHEVDRVPYSPIAFFEADLGFALDLVEVGAVAFHKFLPIDGTYSRVGNSV